jgi:hypothetical protein
MDGLVPLIFHGERSELREKYGLAQSRPEKNALYSMRIGKFQKLPCPRRVCGIDLSP